MSCSASTAAAAYRQHRVYMGCVVGRFANRIAEGRFTLDGTDYRLSVNKNDRNHLHGGFAGFSHKVWSIKSVTENAVSLSLLSPAGEEGYPGTLTVGCRYSIEDERCLRIALTAVTDAPTIVNLATHSYFNLDGAGDVLRHRLEIPADSYLPTDDAGIPTGEFRPGRRNAVRFPHDARRAAGKRRSATTTPMFLHRPKEACARRHASRARARTSEWRSGPPSRASSSTMPQRCGRRRDAAAAATDHTADCASSRNAFPDSPNRSGFTDCALYPGQTYRQITEYRFDLS